MRILQFGMTLNHGGVESFILNYARSLEKDNVFFDYVDLQGVGIAGEEEIRRRGGQIFTLPKDHRKHPFLAARLIRRIVEDGGYRCVHVNMLSAASPVAAIASLRGGAKVIVHAHNTQTVGIHRKILHGMNRHILDRLPVVRLACSENAGRWMFGNKEFTLVPNAIDVDKFRYNEQARSEMRRSLEIPEDTFVLGYVGRLDYQKNPLYLARIMRALKDRTAVPMKLLVIGDGVLRTELLETAAALGVAEDIVLLGRQDNVRRWYSAMDAFVLPSRFEALPVVGVEAQAAGLPCFVSDKITGELKLTELMHLCSLTESAENWAEAICGAMDNKPERHRYAARMREGSYSLERASVLLRDIYTSV